MPNDCLFCRIARHEIPATIVAEDEHALAFRDIDPKAPVHVLVIPKVHVASLNDVADPGLVGHVVRMAVEIARAEGVAESGYRLVANTNTDGGQTVDHLHLHVLGGRHMTWPPG
ncbi:MAG TPA: histidine triad nucleotide-binding protein [Gemmatimonadaceae bacterium]|nr:histidine triad nucleotide-binding protein [Gemmatimonadaceae bacterium]